MSPTTAALKASAESEATLLRLHEAKATPIEAPSGGSLPCDDPWALGVWARVLDEFRDRAAARRLAQHATSLAGHRWKPKVALVLPSSFSPERPAHLRDLAAALEILAATVDHYRIEVLSDGPDAARLFRRVVPCSREAIAACAGALVILSRSLNDEVGAIRPSRYVAADPCGDRVDRKRITFTAAGLELTCRPAEDLEIAREARGCATVLVDEDDDLPSLVEALRRLRAAGLPLRLTLSTRADEDFARRLHADFEDDPRVEVRDPEPGGSRDRPEYLVSNDPITLLLQGPSAMPRYLFRHGRFWVVGGGAPRRSDLYLFRGEESNAHGLLETWLGRRGPSEDRPPSPGPAGSIEPLVSIVIPVLDGTTEIVRLARSIYEQDYPWIEVIFVCAGCRPETMEAVRASENYLMKRRFRVRIVDLSDVHEPRAPARDFGIRAVGGELVCVLETSDWLDPGFFGFLRGQAWRDDTLYCPARIYHDPAHATADGLAPGRAAASLGWLEAPDLVSALRRGEALARSGIVFARALFDRVGGIDHRLTANELFHLWWRAARAGTRAEDHGGRVHISLHPADAGPAAGEGTRLEPPFEPAPGGESIQCP